MRIAVRVASARPVFPRGGWFSPAVEEGSLSP